MTESMRLIPTEEYQRLKKVEEQLEIATKALEVYANTNTWCLCNKLNCSYVDGSVACIALKEMEKIK